MKNTKIEWCDNTVNFWWGCDKVSEACQNCYAEALARRFKKDCFGRNPRWDRYGKATQEIQRLNASAERCGVVESVFINSMSDFFEDSVYCRNIRCCAYDLFFTCQNLQFLLLTKRPENISWYEVGDIQEMPNVHVGITAENQQRFNERMTVIKELGLKAFISAEPLLKPLSISAYASSIDWLICGGESGAKAREFKREWATRLAEQCREYKIPFFYKQDGNNCTDAFDDENEYYPFLNFKKEFPAWHPKGGLA